MSCGDIWWIFGGLMKFYAASAIKSCKTENMALWYDNAQTKKIYDDVTKG